MKSLGKAVVLLLCLGILLSGLRCTSTENTPSDTTAPTISNATVSDITTSSVAISWTTNEASDSEVEYCLTYTDFANVARSALNRSMVTTHSVTLTGLTQGTYYYYLVKSKDAYGNESSSLQFRNFVTAMQQNLVVGQAASNAYQRVTVESAVRTDSYDYQHLSLGWVTAHASSGNIFIIVDALVEDIGTEMLGANAWSFSMSDSQGFGYNLQAYYASDAFNDVTLYPGQKTGGKMLFEVPVTATGLELAYDFGSYAIGLVLTTWAIVP
jgi:hypothetical protein